ncbi:hypothetical protein DPMN_150947 [Dreissena polymorpha]|uniref:Uncharacterized protein n=1 Tax=Dreissena polymorpha TaxID=45954 RepID=A0A9D4FFI3_DREPO|nr:hypothetical protein DPMN_150947 [Dreissena polymorpha]
MTAAEYILKVVSRLYRNSVATLCVFEEPTINDTYAPASLNLEKQFIKNQVFCVRFFKKDAYCVPPFLLHDLNKSAYKENVSGLEERIKVDIFESDALPFLYYLQYLTQGSLGKRKRQLSALGKFVKIVTDKDVELHHPQTATNMLAHCQEMEGNIEAALYMFRKSVQKWPGDNIACWHIDRLYSRGEGMEATNH